MEEEGVELVLARAVELRLKITNCMHSATASPDNDPSIQNQEFGVAEEGGGETQGLLNICDALQALESQLSSLQVMQQNYRYEREAALAEIDYSRRMLLIKLKDYKDEDLEVLKEASSFAGETVEYNTDLLLPPYPSRPPLHLSKLSSSYKFLQNGSRSQANKSGSELERNQARSGSKRSRAPFGHLVGAAAKTLFAIVGMISLLSLAGFGNRIGPFKALRPRMRSIGGQSNSTVQCPPGKVMVVEDGQARCFVKERVEVPFESVVTMPDVDYGCG